MFSSYRREEIMTSFLLTLMILGPVAAGMYGNWTNWAVGR